MKRILFYEHKKNKKEWDFIPVYFEAPWYLWIVYEPANYLSNLFLRIVLYFQDKIENYKS